MVPVLLFFLYLPDFSVIAKIAFLLGEPHIEEERAAVNDETDMLESLTGIPHPEDEILFAVPVCAPYATLLNYKFKGDSDIFLARKRKDDWPIYLHIPRGFSHR